MTDKQIIIDDVPVQDCCYFDYENDGYEDSCYIHQNECSAQNCYYKQFKRKEQELQEAMDNYVQLDLQRVKEYNELVDLYKAKEQECEEFKKKLMQKSEVDMFFNTPLEGWSNDPCEICKYKQTLAEIKEIAEPYKMIIKKTCGNCKKYDDCHACCYKDINCYKYTNPKTDACEEFTYLDKFVPNILANSILQKISECEVENEYS